MAEKIQDKIVSTGDGSGSRLSTNDKPKPKISREKLTRLLQPSQKPYIKAQRPSLGQISITGGKKIIPPTEIPISIKDATATMDLSIGPKIQDEFSRTLDNTVKYVAKSYGMGEVKKGDAGYNMVEADILKQRGSGFSSSKDQFGNTIFAIPSKGGISDLFDGVNDWSRRVDDGVMYLTNDDKSNLDELNARYSERPKGLPYEKNPILFTIGNLLQPIAQGITGAFAGSSVAGPYGAIPGFITGMGTTFALSAPDGVSARYGDELQSNYFEFKNQGLSDNEAYEKASQVAKVAAGGEVVLQGFFSAMGLTPKAASIIGGGAKAALLGDRAASIALSSKPIIDPSKKKAFNKIFGEYGSKFIEGAKSTAAVGAMGALSRALPTTEAIEQGAEGRSVLEDALEGGGQFATMDGIIRVVTGIVSVPKSIRATAKEALVGADKKVINAFVKSGEANGTYPSGTSKKLNQSIESYNEARSQTPDFGSDVQRTATVTGLTEKLSQLKKKQSELADIHKKDLDAEIKSIEDRIEIAKRAENPLEAESYDDGTPMIRKQEIKFEQEKPITDATTISKGEVKEGAPEGRIGEYQRTEEVKPAETTVKEKTAAADIGDSVVSGKEAEITFADRIRKLKIDETLLTGGEPGAAQSNIAGLPIAIYNASIEAIALGVEQGGKLADLIAEQIKGLKEAGYKVDDIRYSKDVESIQKLSEDRSKALAEAEMAGIKSDDYSQLQRYALELYKEGRGVTDTYEMGQRLRTELNKKIDTSNISDEVFEMAALDAIVNKEAFPFKAGRAVREPLPEGARVITTASQKILTTPKEIFKAIYRAETTVGKSIQERLSDASEAVKLALKTYRNIDVDANKLTKAISQFVSSKFDTDTAASAFEDNLDEIINIALNENQIAANRQTIKSIKKISKQSTATVAVYENIPEFISPSKLVDDVSSDGSILKTAEQKQSEYAELLEDFRRSISGEITQSKTPRNDLFAFIQKEKDAYKNHKDLIEAKKTERYAAQYDKMVESGEIDPMTVTKDEFIDGKKNPQLIKSGDVDDAVNKSESSEFDVYNEISNEKKGRIKDRLDNGDFTPEEADIARILIETPTELIQPKNLKLFNRILEDFLNGEEISRFGEILSDVISYGIKKEVSSAPITIRNLNTALALAKNANFDKLGLTNMFRAISDNDTGADFIRGAVLGEFELGINKSAQEATQFQDNMSNVFTGRTAKDASGETIKLEGPSLTEKNSYRLGVVSALLQYNTFSNTVNTMVESLKSMSRLVKESSKTQYKVQLDKTLTALQELGIIKSISYDSDGIIQNIDIDTASNIESVMQQLNHRETVALNLAIGTFKKMRNDVNYITRNYYDESIDFTNESYLPQSVSLIGGTPNIEISLKLEGEMPEHVGAMRASTTKYRLPEMPSVGRDGSYLHYNYDFFNVIPKKYHETSIMINTTPTVKNMQKVINSKEFKSFINGRYNIEPSEFIDNSREFNKILTFYVNQSRRPYDVSPAILKERSGWFKFAYSTLVNGVDAVIKQYIPSIPTLIVESPSAFLKSSEIVGQAMSNPSYNRALLEFMSQTKQTQRVAGGIESMLKNAKRINDNALTRTAFKISDSINDVAGVSFAAGDMLVSVQSILIGYMKHLLKTGKIKSLSEFNIVDEIEKGLDPRALAAGENFHSFVNSESNFHSKAAVFRSKDARYMRFLQSFSHNQLTNFLVDVGRASDAIGQKDIYSASEHIKKALTYPSSLALYGATSYYLGNMWYDVANDYYKSRGIITDSEEYKKEVEKKKNRSAVSLGTGVLFDAMMARRNVVSQEMIRGGIDMAVNAIQDITSKAKMERGEDVEGTIYEREYTPLIEGRFLGPIGAYVEGLERFGESAYRQISAEEQYKGLLTKEQEEASFWVMAGQAAGVAFPSKDIRRLADKSSQVLKIGKMTQLEKDAIAYEILNDKYGFYNEFDGEWANEYYAKRKGEAKDIKNFDQYWTKRVAQLADKSLTQQRIKSMATDRFGKKFTENIDVIKKSSQDAKFKIINNLFPGQDINSSEISFMIEYGIISPEDYAFMNAYDKNGRVRKDKSIEAIANEAKDRFAKAMTLKDYSFIYKGAYSLTEKFRDLESRLRQKAYESQELERRRR